MLNLIKVYLTTTNRPAIRARVRLADFFKHTHPDLLQNAPQLVKD